MYLSASRSKDPNENFSENFSGSGAHFNTVLRSCMRLSIELQSFMRGRCQYPFISSINYQVVEILLLYDCIFVITRKSPMEDVTYLGTIGDAFGAVIDNFISI